MVPTVFVTYLCAKEGSQDGVILLHTNMPRKFPKKTTSVLAAGAPGKFSKTYTSIIRTCALPAAEA